MLIAEVGSVHDGSFGNAIKLIELAKHCGADAVKFQTHIAGAESCRDAPSPKYFSGEARYEYLTRTSFNLDQWKELKKFSDHVGITFMSSPFSIEAVDLLEEVGIESYKIPSGEVSNLPLLEHVSSISKPVFLSSGMSDWDELDLAVATLGGNCDLTVMQCSSAYPCSPQQVGLNVISEMIARYGRPIGFSDHTLGFAAPVAAAACGAKVVEKHLTFSKQMYGSDAANAMEPHEFKFLSVLLGEVWSMIDSPVDKSDLSEFEEMKIVFEKSVVSRSSLEAGTIIRREHMAFKKPGSGFPAKYYKNLIGKRLIKSKVPDEFIFPEDLA